MQVRTKIWIERNNVDIFGSGRYLLLLQVQETGSLNQAAANMGMSYRAAWGKLKDTEKRIGFKLLEGRTGGPHGGGSTLTPRCLQLLEAYHHLDEEISRVSNNLVEKHLDFLDSTKGS